MLFHRKQVAVIQIVIESSQCCVDMPHPLTEKKEKPLETVVQNADRCRCLTHCAAYVTATVNIKHWTI